MSSSSTINVAVLRLVLFSKRAPSNYKATQTPAYTHICNTQIVGSCVPKVAVEAIRKSFVVFLVQSLTEMEKRTCTQFEIKASLSKRQCSTKWRTQQQCSAGAWSLCVRVKFHYRVKKQPDLRPLSHSLQNYSRLFKFTSLVVKVLCL